MKKRLLTEIEVAIWINAFGDGSPTAGLDKQFMTAPARACKAVIAFRGEGNNPLPSEVREMQTEIKSINRLQREGLVETKSQSKAVSLDWVLNQLAGMSFPKVGGAYDFIKDSAKED